MSDDLKSRIVALDQIEDTSNFLIFVQGNWEFANNERNVAASNAIREHGIASTLLYESSRDWNYLENWPQDKPMEDPDWKRAFGDKTYEDELRELRDLINHINSKYNPANIYLSGSSFGGGLATLVAGDGIPNLSRVLLCCPTISIDKGRPQESIYKGFLAADEFLLAISRFHGGLRNIHVETDDFTPVNHSSALYYTPTTNDQRFVILPGQHTFSDNIPGYVQEHIEAFR